MSMAWIFMIMLYLEAIARMIGVLAHMKASVWGTYDAASEIGSALLSFALRVARAIVSFDM
jgi:hypothetical protein